MSVVLWHHVMRNNSRMVGNNPSDNDNPDNGCMMLVLVAMIVTVVLLNSC
jgi:hypothetical protein